MAFVYWIHHKDHTDIFTQGYVGITDRTVEKRYSEHKQYAFAQKKNMPLYNAMRKYGDDIVIDTIVIAELEYVAEVEKKLRSEQYIGWNLAIGGDTPYRHVFTDEDRARCSERLRHRKISDSFRRKTSERMKNTVKSAEWNKKIGDTLRGRKLPEEHRKAISEGQIGSKHSEETKEKMREMNNPFWNFRNYDLSYWASADQWYILYRAGESFTFYVDEGVDPKSKLKKMLMRFEKGWNPAQDLAWCSWNMTYSGERNPPLAQKRVNKRDIKFLAGLRKDVSSNIEVLHELFLSGKSSSEASKMFDTKKDILRPLFVRFKSGWNPHDCHLYKYWKEEYEPRAIKIES